MSGSGFQRKAPNPKVFESMRAQRIAMQLRHDRTLDGPDEKSVPPPQALSLDDNEFPSTPTYEMKADDIITLDPVVRDFLKEIDVPLLQRMEKILDLDVKDQTLDQAISALELQMMQLNKRLQKTKESVDPKIIELNKSLELNHAKTKSPKLLNREEYLLGLLYFWGIGINPDYARAKRYFEEAANRKFAPALSRLGVMCELGLACSKDENLARDYYNQADQLGCSSGSYNLASLELNGIGGNKDVNSSREHYEKAARQVCALALCDLGSIYIHGLGVTKDATKARDFYATSASLGNATTTLFNLGLCYRRGDGVNKDLAIAAFYWRLSEAAAYADNTDFSYILADELLKTNIKLRIEVSYHAALAKDNYALFDKIFKEDPALVLELFLKDLQYNSGYLTKHTINFIREFLTKYSSIEIPEASRMRIAIIITEECLWQ